MRCHLIAVGRMAAAPLRAVYDEYARRLTPALALIEVEERRKLPEPALRGREAELILDAMPKSAVLVALDEGGTALPSVAFAHRLELWRDQGTADIAFAIGGAAGHGAAVIERASFVWSLGPATWPHMLVRVMVAEQLYRAAAILAGHPYHRA